MSRLAQNVQITASDKGLDRGLKGAERKIESFLARANKLNETTAKFAQLGSIALGGGAVGSILSAPFRLTSAFTDSMASASSKAKQALADFDAGRIRQISDSGLTPGLAASLAARADEFAIAKNRRDAAVSLFVGNATAGDGWGASYARNFSQGLRGFMAGAGAFIANIDRGYSYASRASDLASWQAQAETDAESNYWLAIRAKEGNAGAEEELAAITARTWERIRAEQASPAQKTFELLRQQLSGI